MTKAGDLSGLLLLYSSLGNSSGMKKLADLAVKNGKINVAFVCLFMLGKLEECLQLLIDRYFQKFILLDCAIVYVQS